jgi:hypothetical protein
VGRRTNGGVEEDPFEDEDPHERSYDSQYKPLLGRDDDLHSYSVPGRRMDEGKGGSDQLENSTTTSCERMGELTEAMTIHYYSSVRVSRVQERWGGS